MLHAAEHHAQTHIALLEIGHGGHDLLKGGVIAGLVQLGSQIRQLLGMGGVVTHAEAALVDGYGAGSGDSETRWDLYWVLNGEGKLIRGGDHIRQLAQYYSQALVLLAPPSSEQM